LTDAFGCRFVSIGAGGRVPADGSVRPLGDGGLCEADSCAAFRAFCGCAGGTGGGDVACLCGDGSSRGRWRRGIEEAVAKLDSVDVTKSEFFLLKHSQGSLHINLRSRLKGQEILLVDARIQQI
jgi:hypothetical protein